MDMVNRSQGLSSVEFLSGPLMERRFPLNKQIITIGRAPTNDIVVQDQSVSGQHVQLFNNGGQWYIKKLTPTNTVTINFRQQVETAPVAINDDDTIFLGGVINFRFHATSSASVSGAAPSPSSNLPHLTPPQQSFPPPSYSSQRQPPQQSIAPPAYSSQPLSPQQSFALPNAEPYSPSPSYTPPGAQMPGAGMQPSLNAPYYTEPVPPGSAPGSAAASIEVISNIHPNKNSLPLTKDVINIGRNPSNDVVIPEEVVSGYHAQIVREGNQYVFIHPHPQARQGRTLNGVIFQGQHIKGDESFRRSLVRGDFFRIGDEHGTLITISYNDGS